MKFLVLPILLFVTLAVLAQDPCKNVYTESAWQDRDLWQKPDSILLLLAIQPGQQVADIGCHEGYMTMKLSKAVGNSGRVYAIDIEPLRLEKLKEHLASRKITNVSIIKSELGDPKLSDKELDAVLIIDTYHEMKNHNEILRLIKAALKSTGRLVICEAIAEERRHFSREDQERKHELSMSFAIADLRKAGFLILMQQDPFIDREKIKGDKMWIIVATKR